MPVDYAAKIKEAYERIKGDIRRTPVEYSEPLSRETGAKVYVKWECDQTTGSFKLRGALNKLRSLSREDRAKGVVSASTGNHGLAISHAAKLEGVGLKLFLPETVAEVKKQRIEALGVDVEVRGASCDKAEAIAREFAGRTGRVFVSPYNDWDIVYGAGHGRARARRGPGALRRGPRAGRGRRSHRRDRGLSQGRPAGRQGRRRRARDLGLHGRVPRRGPSRRDRRAGDDRRRGRRRDRARFYHLPALPRTRRRDRDRPREP